MTRDPWRIIGRMLTAGTILDGRYEIVEPLAEGGMGAVFRARRRLLGDEVALKIVRTEIGADQTAQERFLRESQACARLRHPNIVSILDYNLDAGGRPFLVMELLNGRSLRQEIRFRGWLPIEEVQAIIGPLCDALQLAHDQGILHRDLKPANIVAHDFGGGARVHKIVDFGLVRMQSSDSTRLTGAHQFLGTLSYASPEQILGSDAGARIGSVQPGRRDLRAADGPSAVRGKGTHTARERAHHRGVPAAQRAAAGPSEVDRRRPGAGPGQVAGGSLRVDGRISRGRCSKGAGASRSTRARSAPRRCPPAADCSRRTSSASESAPAGLGSEVLSGTHRALGHPVAIRLLRRGSERSWEAVRARFLREAQTLQIAHPSIIQVRDYGEEGDLVYLVTDFLGGCSLRDALKTGGAMPWPRLKPLLAQLFEAARALHRKGGLLCGLGPEIMRVAPEDEGERLMISTAGIWQASDLLTTLGDDTLRGTTLADVELHYVAPELLTGQNADVRSDVFTMGVLAYEMATATLPFVGASMPALLGAMLRGRPADPRTRSRRCPTPPPARF